MSSGLRQRVITAIIIGIPILLLVFYSDMSRSAFLCIIGILMSWEYLTIVKSSLRFPAFKWIGIISTLILLGAAFMYGQDIIQFILPVSLIANIYLIFELVTKKPLLQLKMPLLWNLLYVVLPVSVLLSLRSTDVFATILISILLMVWISDSGAYFVGKSTGKRKLFPSVSPGKTWEGFLGAGLLSAIFSYAFFSYFGTYTVSIWACIALLVWLTGSAGDLVESKLKRKLGIKDSGNIMPGHGGFLDRFDAFIFCIPFVVSLIYYLT